MIPRFVIAALFMLAAPALAADRPNVLLIIGDDQGWGDFGFMGHRGIRTPNLDRLAHESATFVNGYVPTPLCRPSLASILTGVYPHQHRICWNDPPRGTDRNGVLNLMGDSPTIPRLLGRSGYVSLQTGKFWEGRYSNAGFTHGMSLNEVHGRHGDEGLRIGRDTMKPIYDFIENRDGKPFFVWYAPMLPHEPHNPPARLLEKYRAPDRPIEIAKYWAMCEWFDETCGELLTYLDTHNLRDNTIVVFVIDNGWIQNVSRQPAGEGRREARGFAPKSKQSPYDGGLRTPILVRWPGKVAPGRHEALASSLDFAPTILAACGVPLDSQMTGQNLIDLAAGRIEPRRSLCGEVFVHSALSVEKPAENLRYRWVRQGDLKLILPVPSRPFESLTDRQPANASASAPARIPGGEPELYNLRRDPHENNNLAPAQPERVADLTRILDEWWKP